MSGSKAAHMDSALALGKQPLTVSRIVQGRLGPRFVLLPVCHAGETREDEAGNALGVAAGFLLSGTRVVVASAKAVPDLLIPWFTTLVAWHIVNDEMSDYAAAARAREEFGACEFPDDYRNWLTEALPDALCVLHDGGAEHARLLAACVQRAGDDGQPQQVRSRLLSTITDDWPWQGDSAGLFSSDPAEHATALASVAAGVLQPHGAIADSLHQAMREMAAFINIYGTD